MIILKRHYKTITYTAKSKRHQYWSYAQDDIPSFDKAKTGRAHQLVYFVRVPKAQFVEQLQLTTAPDLSKCVTASLFFVTVLKLATWSII